MNQKSPKEHILKAVLDNRSRQLNPKDPIYALSRRLKVGSTEPKKT